MPGEFIVPHALGLRLPGDQVTHACPECPIGDPNMFCPACQGRGNLTTQELDAYLRRLEWQAHQESR